MKIDMTVCECASWTDAESKEAIALLEASIPLIPVEFDSDDDIGIYIGVDDECVKIDKEFMDKTGGILEKPLGQSGFYRFQSEKDGYAKYYGKVYTGFKLVAGGCELRSSYLSLKDAVKAAISVYHGLIAVKHELNLTIADAPAKEFGLK